MTVQVYDSAGRPVANSAQTDSLGKYTVTRLLPGNYFVKAASTIVSGMSAGYLSQVYGAAGPCLLSCDVTFGATVAVTAGASATADIALTPSGWISGTVVDRGSNTPVGGASLYVYSAAGVNVGYARTRQDGTYRYAQPLEAGAYYVEASANTYLRQVYGVPDCETCSVMSGTAVAVSNGAGVTGVDFSLRMGGSIGAPWPILERFADVERDADALRRVGQVGRVGLALDHAVQVHQLASRPILPPGDGPGPLADSLLEHTLQHDGRHPPRDANHGDRAETAGIDFALPGGATISGTVTASGLPLARVTVRAYNERNVSVASAASKGDGTYALSGIPAGRYFLTTTNGLGYLNVVYPDIACSGSFSCNATQGAAVDVASGSTVANINFSLVKGGSIAGVVTDRVTRAAVANASVSIIDQAGVVHQAVGTVNSGVYRQPAWRPAGPTCAPRPRAT